MFSRLPRVFAGHCPAYLTSSQDNSDTHKRLRVAVLESHLSLFHCACSVYSSIFCLRCVSLSFFFFGFTSLLLPTRLPPSSSCVSAQSCNPMDYSPPGFSVRAFFQGRILEWIAISFSIFAISVTVTNLRFLELHTSVVLNMHF